MDEYDWQDLDRRLQCAATGANVHTANKARCYIEPGVLKSEPMRQRLMACCERALYATDGSGWTELRYMMRRLF